MQQINRVSAGMAAAFAIAVAVVAAASNGLPRPAGAAAQAEVRFGLDHAGSPFPPQAQHDRSFNAADNVVPRTVVIRRGESIQYDIGPFHQVAIYRPGTQPEEIRVDDGTLRDLSLPCLPQTLGDFVIDDPNGRVALGPGQACERNTWTTPAGTFDEPGRYLVICTTAPHFRGGMWGWVIVR